MKTRFSTGGANHGVTHPVLRLEHLLPVLSNRQAPVDCCCILLQQQLSQLSQQPIWLSHGTIAVMILTMSS